MTPSQFQRAAELFLEACGREPDARATFLDTECHDDEMRAAIEAWLTEDASPQALDHGVDLMPRRIGAFEIVRPLGEGGMGIVYEAQQEEPRRRVALKVIRRGAVSRNLLRRFRHEVRVLGQLQHPGIAQIYEAGTVDEGPSAPWAEKDGGRPYFAMELVRGSSLRDYAETHGSPFGEDADQGSGTLFLDPQFVDPDAGNFHLMAASPCIDTGDNGAVPAGLETDLDGNVRIVDGDDDDVADVDMGVYELGAVITCPADVTGDGAVDVQDMVEVILNWGCMDPPDSCPADLTGDGVVDVQDLVEVVLAWGPCS